MNDFDLLSYVQPEAGFYCVLGISPDNKTTQRLVATREELDELAEHYVSKGLNTFFAVAKFNTDESRKQDNVRSLKAFWLDLDCGPSKAEENSKTGIPQGYINQTAALTELKRFCQVTGLPKPTVVNSGRGLHVYWALEEAVTRDQWEPVAARLRDVCDTQKLYVDRAVFEVARVLRIPGTYNFKDNPPTKVSVMMVGSPISYDGIKDILGVQESAFLKQAHSGRKLTALGQKILDNMESSFAKIMRRSAEGDGCNQLLQCYTERATLAEPRWFNALSVAKFCSDSNKAIHKLSAEHPEYDPEEVEKKIAHIAGPHSCLKFEENNPGGCDGCPFKGKIRGPITLGKEIIRATEADNVVEVEDENNEVSTVIIPEMPEPFFRGKNGGLYIMEGEKPQLVYENDIYVVKRMTDPHAGDVVVMRVHLPKDGMKEFVIPNTKVTERSELRKELSKNGVVTGDTAFKLLAIFVVQSIKDLQNKRSAEIMRDQFGWADNNTKFVVGSREITHDHVYHSPPSTITDNVAPYFEPQGTLEKWAEVFMLYNREGLEVQAFAALSGFGSPLLKFTEQKGCVINLIHSLSGAGKTTVLRAAASVCGHPEMLLGNPEDTKNAKITKAGILNNIVNPIDEMTNIRKEDLSDLMYAFSQGKGKERNEASSNKLRINSTTWRNITLSASNSSFVQKLQDSKKTPDGELMRLLEFPVEHSTVVSRDEGVRLFDQQLNSNYGHAIVPFVQYVIANLDEVKVTLERIRLKVSNDLGLTQRERNWAAVLACNFTAGLIINKLGIIKFDMQRIYKQIIAKLGIMKEDTAPPLDNCETVLSEYVISNMDCILAVDDQADQRTKLPPLPRMLPRRELRIRYEPNTMKSYYVIKFLRQHFSEQQVDYREFLRELKKRGVAFELDNKRIAKGMKVDISSSPRCLIIDHRNSPPDFLSMESFIPADEETVEEDAGEDRESDVRD